METVKVDIQKLQLLNDRIAQTIEALNQVRLSVHGIQHSSQPQVSPWGFGTPYGMYAQPYPVQQQSYAQYSPFTQTPFAASPFGQPFGQPFGPGIQHTSPMTSTLSPLSTLPTSTWATPFTTPFTNGISHSSWDPSWQARTAQMFPFVQYPWPVTIS